MGKFINFIKKFPIDFGQKELRHNTYAKKLALEFANENGRGLALDLGCADGYWTEKLKNHRWKLVAVDKESSYAGAIHHDLNMGIPFPDNHFDLVWSTEVLAYLTDTKFIIREIHRVLKPGGRYIITTPNNGFWLNELLCVFGQSLKSLQDQRQKHFFTISDIQTLFPAEKIYGFFPYIWKKYKIAHLVGLLSPTFIIVGTKK